LIRKETGGGGYRRCKGDQSKEHRREERVHTADKQTLILNAKVSLLVEGWGVSSASPSQAKEKEMKNCLLLFIEITNIVTLS